MSTEAILTDEQIEDIIEDIAWPNHEVSQYAMNVARTVEQAVLQSPEVRALRKDGKRLDFLIAEECQIQALSLSNGTRHRLYWPDLDEAQTEWFANPRAAIDAAMEKQT